MNVLHKLWGFADVCSIMLSKATNIETNSQRGAHMHACPTNDKPTQLDDVATGTADRFICFQNGSNHDETRMPTPNLENGDVMEQESSRSY